MPSGQGKGPPLLLLEELLASQDARFLEAVRQASDPKVLAGVAEKWKRDPRPWARQQIFAYLDAHLDRHGHQPLIKRLFKHAEEKRDDELVGAFMLSFDRLIRRKLVKRWHYDYRARQSWETEMLVTPAQPTVPPAYRVKYAPGVPEKKVPEPYQASRRLFSTKTRKYLRRRAWRYFRRMAFQRPAEYAPALARALSRYEDNDLKDGIAILDSWGLLHACFFDSPVIEFTQDHANLAEGRGMPELAATPFKDELWARPEAAKVLLDLVGSAASRLVRTWAIELVRMHHKQALADLPAEAMLKLLDSEDEQVQQFAAELLSTARGLERLPLATWLKMLQTANLTALAVIADVMRKHVSVERFELGQLIELATVKATPAARLGLAFLKEYVAAGKIWTSDQRGQLAGLAAARCAAIGRELAGFALGVLGAKGSYDVELVAPFFDSLTREVREGAWEWLVGEAGVAAYDDAALWSRLLETPYEELRLKLVEQLEKRSELPGQSGELLAGTWTAVLLGVFRGGRHKLKAVRQVSEAIARKPEEAAALVPVLAVAVRSVRSPEARHGLAALVAAVERRPELAEAVKKYLPELEFAAGGVC